MTMADGEDEPGDAVCWLHQLCPECGAMPTKEQPERCWRCGATLPDDPPPAGNR